MIFILFLRRPGKVVQFFDVIRVKMSESRTFDQFDLRQSRTFESRTFDQFAPR